MRWNAPALVGLPAVARERMVEPRRKPAKSPAPSISRRTSARQAS